MSIKTVLRKIEEKMEYVHRLKLNFSGNELAFNSFDIINMYYVNLTMTDEDFNYDVLIHPTRQMTLIYYIIAAALTAYEMDLTDVSSELINNLKIGDKVKVNGCLGEYLGKNKILDDIKLKVKFSDMDYYIPTKTIWKISKYEGNATRLNKFNGRRDIAKQKGKNVLSEIFGIDKKKHNIVQKSKIIVVTQKKFATNTFKKLEINNMQIAQIFPTGYYLTEEKMERIGRDPYQRTPVICFTSDLSVAYKLLDDYTRLIIFDTSSYTFIPVVQIEQFIKTNHNMITLMNNNEKDLFIFNKIGMNLYRWDKETLKEIYLLDKLMINNSKKKEIINHMSFLYNYINHCSKIHKIETQESFRFLRDKIIRYVEKVKENSLETLYTLKYIITVYRVLLFIQTLVCPVAFIDEQENHRSISNIINEMNTIIPYALSGMHEKNVNNLNLLTELPELLKEYVYHLQNQNQKGEKLIEILNDLQGTTGIVVRKKRDKQIIQEWLKFKGITDIEVLLYIELKKNKIYRNLIFTGWFKEIRGYPLRHELSENHIFIIYDFEESFLSCLNMKENNNRVPTILEKFESKNWKIKREYEKEISAKKVEKEDISGILLHFSSIYARIDYNLDSNSVENGDSLIYEEAYLIDFVEDYYAYLTDGFRSHILSRNNEKVILKSVKELKIGDELVFSIHNKGDIFEELVSRIEEENPEVKKIKQTADLWQDALNHYITQNVDISSFIKQLKEYGYTRVEATIENWLNNYDQIAPGEYEIIDIIAKITGDKKLKQNIDEVIKSCKKLRILHVQLGRYIAKMIIHSVFSDAEDENILFDFKFINPADYAVVVTINKISKNKSLVPKYKVNKLIEKF